LDEVLKSDRYIDDEITVPYCKVQKDLYKKNDPKCIIPQWDKKIGIHRFDGNFAAMVVRKYLEDNGYFVFGDYLLVRCPRKREKNKGLFS